MSFANFAIESGINSAKPAEPAPAGSDPKPTPAASGGPPSVPSTSPGAPAAPNAPAADALEDDGELSFGLDDTDDDGGTGGAPAEDSDTEPIQPIGPPEGATKAEIADWRETHGVPETADAYQAPEIDGVPWNAEALSPIMEVAHRHNVPQAALAEALSAYAEQAQQQQANLKRQDKERLAEVKTRLTPGERAAVNAASSAVSPDLRRAMKQARLPTGELLIHNQEFLHLLANLNRQGGTSKVAIAQNDAAREAQIRQLMKTDYHSYITSGAAEELTAILNRKGQ